MVSDCLIYFVFLFFDPRKRKIGATEKLFQIPMGFIQGENSHMNSMNSINGAIRWVSPRRKWNKKEFRSPIKIESPAIILWLKWKIFIQQFTQLAVAASGNENSWPDLSHSSLGSLKTQCIPFRFYYYYYYYLRSNAHMNLIFVRRLVYCSIIKKCAHKQLLPGMTPSIQSEPVRRRWQTMKRSIWDCSVNEREKKNEEKNEIDSAAASKTNHQHTPYMHTIRILNPVENDENSHSYVRLLRTHGTYIVDGHRDFFFE